MNSKVIKDILDKNFDFDEIAKDFPIIYELKNIEQNPKYHEEGNVYIHTKRVCQQVINLPQWEKLNCVDKVTLYLAAFFHDIGKLICTKTEDGEIISPKHGVKGAKLFREFFYKYENISFSLREEIAALIKYHGLPLFFMDRNNMDYDLIKASEVVNMKLLYLIAKADLLGRECDDKEELFYNIECFKEYTNELACFYSSKKFSNKYSRFLYLNKQNIWHGDNVFDITTFQVTIMVGFPLAGKDTYIKNNLKSIPIISLDNIREELRISPKKNSSKVAAIAKERVKNLLKEKKPFVWNATNLSKDIRKNLCNVFSAYGARVKFVYIEVPYKELLLRNKIRNRTVPEKVINNMISKFDMIEKWEGYEVEYIVID
ncbi:putative nucleotidyltransferase with HDIG domain [Clostridium tetanomorphum]|uniref:AAA family ATPase n=1 Tax=Clostridium tetanomorphum TaxID=1553 RepID=A0A923J0Y3_CLOTT|nr:AAA family ATPase [Clostridium tetanomorphum]KAJ50782.1 PolyA polymerase-like protein [Clostridium tetanomorphum DSM 665]MBC2398577.1 AAA family ATPase [Clostridium tetanomorphum]MBP1866411.1 putative nucleotidyltransferase with HDIG domain [Clostridium tetanomorphum]NRS83197.1 putative nucleotidyltransferase with HDIG domain [Clostridium tetanomorphum]NRZ98703.1 putative nucleotidyltransferase with HDIG domain [Clostridium tetanomorphum]